MNRSAFKLSLYTRTVYLSNGSSQVILHNVLSGHKILVESTILENIIQNGNRDALTHDEWILLTEQGYLVPNDLDEFARFRNKHVEQVHSPSSFAFTASTTMECNLACHYCFQQEFRSSRSMTEETAVQIAKQVVNYVQEHNLESISGVFFGGEPLLNPLPILACLSELKARKPDNVHFRCGLISNGSPLTESLLCRLVDLGLSSIQITLDGPREFHDSRRPTVKGLGSFDRAVAAIRLAAKKIMVVANAVVDSDNAPYLRELVHFISDSSINDGNVAFQFTKTMTRHLSPAERDSDDDATNTAIADAICEAGRLGYEVYGSGTRSPCTQYKAHAVAFGPDGSIYKCVDVIEDRHFLIGSELSPATTAPVLRAWMERCASCSVAPICQGGCGYKGLSAGRAMDQLYCEQPYLESVSDAQAVASMLLSRRHDQS